MVRILSYIGELMSLIVHQDIFYFIDCNDFHLTLILFYHGATAHPPPLGQGLLVIKDSLSHSARLTALGRTPLGE